MNYLLDTNVISESTKPQPHSGVIAWLREIDEDQVFLSAITIAEVSRGIALREAGRQRDRLEHWLRRDLLPRFEHRLLPINRSVAEAWGGLMARSRRRGIGLSVIDGFLAATASTHGLMLVTRNVVDFEKLGIDLFDPWNA